MSGDHLVFAKSCRFHYTILLLQKCNPSFAIQHLVFSGSVDTKLRGWDLRKPATPLFTLDGHHYAVRRLRVSEQNFITSPV